MKVWKAELILSYIEDNKYDTRFTFEKQEGDYRINDLNNTEYIYSEGWGCDRIPTKMTIEDTYCLTIKVTQGFNQELDKNELKKIEKDMRKFMRQYLESEKENYLKVYENKLKAIKDI